MTMSNNVDVVVTMQDRASPKLRGLTEHIQNNQTAWSDMAMGATFAGTAFVSWAQSLEKSNNESAKMLAGVLNLVGGILSAAGATVYFTYVVGKMVNALKAFNIAQTIANALAGPGGWVKLAIGGAVAGGAIYGITRLTGGGGGGGTRHEMRAGEATTINMTVQGSVVTERELTDKIQEGLARKDQRNATRTVQ